MAGKLTDFALRLSQHPTELAAFRSSPAAAEAAMEAAGLSERDRVVMRGGDQRAIGEAIAAESRAVVATEEAMEAPGLPPIEIPPIDVPLPEPMEAPLTEPMEAPDTEPMEAPPPTEAMEAHGFVRVAAKAG